MINQRNLCNQLRVPGHHGNDSNLFLLEKVLKLIIWKDISKINEKKQTSQVVWRLKRNFLRVSFIIISLSEEKITQIKYTCCFRFHQTRRICSPKGKALHLLLKQKMSAYWTESMKSAWGQAFNAQSNRSNSFFFFRCKHSLRIIPQSYSNHFHSRVIDWICDRISTMPHISSYPVSQAAFG